MKNLVEKPHFSGKIVQVIKIFLKKMVSVGIGVGQWLVSGLQWFSSVQQSLAARQKELSE